MAWDWMLPATDFGERQGCGQTADFSVLAARVVGMTTAFLLLNALGIHFRCRSSFVNTRAAGRLRDFIDLAKSPREIP
jgi:hypothetical protein